MNKTASDSVLKKSLFWMADRQRSLLLLTIFIVNTASFGFVFYLCGPSVGFMALLVALLGMYFVAR